MVAAFSPGGTRRVALRAYGWVPPALDPAQQATLKAAIGRRPRDLGLGVSTWQWKAIRQYVRERFGITLACSTCHAYLHRLGFVHKRPKKRLLKADPLKRAAFVRQYAQVRAQAEHSGAKLFFADEAHFYADVDLRRLWVQKGTEALVETTSPRYGEKASYYSAVCLESGEVTAMGLEGHSSAATSVEFLRQLRAQYAEPLIVFWDNGPAHGGAALRAYLRTPHLGLRLVRLPAYSPDFNADEHIWAWARDEATANTCFGTAEFVRQCVDAFFAQLTERADEVRQRCRTELQARADRLVAHECLTSQAQEVA